MDDLTADEAAAMLQISASQVRRLVAAGRLAGRRVGGEKRRGTWLISRTSVKAEVARRKAKDDTEHA